MVSMYWAKRSGNDYLYATQTTQVSGSNVGVRNAATEAQLAAYLADKQVLQLRVTNAVA